MATRDVTARDMLHRAADWFPQGERVVDGLFRYTYPQLREQVQRCAALYHALGVRKGDRVALMTVGSVQHTVACSVPWNWGRSRRRCMCASRSAP